MTVEYREATAAVGDFEHIFALGKLMHEESCYSHLEFSPKRLFEIMDMYMRDPDKVIFLALRDGKALGLYAGFVSKYFFSEELVANDVAWFVLRDKRGSRIGLRLLDKFEKWAEGRGVSEVRLGFSTDINGDGFDSLMKKRGYNRVGFNYRLNGKEKDHGFRLG